MFICNLCPRKCSAVRDDESNMGGFCAMPEKFKIARAMLHTGEEPCISGKNGSAAIFFSGCNLKCVFCQNYDISHKNEGKIVDDEELADIIGQMIDAGAHNINLVNPTHYAKRISDFFEKYHFDVPVIYNTSSYEEVETLKMLEGKIDVYLPDLKYIRSDKSLKYSGVSDYFEKASKAVLEMIRQVGAPQFDENSMIKKGVIVRHLILPSNTNSSIEILKWLDENVCDETLISLMAQYTPLGESEKYPEISRRLTERELKKTVDFLENECSLDGYVQEIESANICFVPDFKNGGFLKR